MTDYQFLAWVELQPEIEGISLSSDGCVVKHTLTKLGTFISWGALESVNIGVIESIIKGEREPDVINHMTRVCGYYSYTKNWNPSKLGELTDRHKGDYIV